MGDSQRESLEREIENEEREVWDKESARADALSNSKHTKQREYVLKRLVHAIRGEISASVALRVWYCPEK